MAVYRAPAPFVSEYERRLFIFKLIFPLTALWQGLKFVINFCFGRALGKVILRPLSANDIGDDLIEDISTYNTENLKCSFETVITHDGCVLDTIEIKHRAQEKLPPSEKKYIIYLNGRWGCYEKSIAKIIDTANELEQDVISFNYRGVGKSTGCVYSKKDLYTDVIAQIQRLLDQGVEPQFIVLRGYSLGGALATKVAKHFFDQGIILNVFNERSFSNVMHVIAGFLRHIGAPAKSGHRSGTLGIILSYVLWPFVKLALLLNEWEIEAADAFKELPVMHKEYIAVRSPKERLAADEKIVDDSGVTHYASLHRAMKSVRKEEKNKIKAARKNNHELVTSNPVVNRALKKADAHYVEVLDYLKSRKMIANDEDKHQNAHYIDLKDLISRATNQSGMMFFKNFVRNTQELREEELREERLDEVVAGVV